MHTQSCINNCEISNFGFLQCLFFLGRLTRESMGNYKKCFIMQTAGRRAKRTKIWDSGTLVTHMWCTFDLVVFKFSLRSFGARVSKRPVTPKRLVVERNGVTFETRGQFLYKYRVIRRYRVQGKFLGAFSALVSKWPISRKGLVIERNGVKFGNHEH